MLARAGWQLDTIRLHSSSRESTNCLLERSRRSPKAQVPEAGLFRSRTRQPSGRRRAGATGERSGAGTEAPPARFCPGMAARRRVSPGRPRRRLGGTAQTLLWAAAAGADHGRPERRGSRPRRRRLRWRRCPGAAHARVGGSVSWALSTVARASLTRRAIEPAFACRRPAVRSVRPSVDIDIAIKTISSSSGPARGVNVSTCVPGGYRPGPPHHPRRSPGLTERRPCQAPSPLAAPTGHPLAGPNNAE
jgi:hypothetical protein